MTEQEKKKKKPNDNGKNKSNGFFLTRPTTYLVEILLDNKYK